MPRQLFLPFVIMLLALVPAPAASMSLNDVNSAELGAKAPVRGQLHPAVVRAQIMLDRSGFSPGEIDGKLGENVEKAIFAYAEANGLAGGPALTPEVWTKLTAATDATVMTEYEVTAADVKGPFVRNLPSKLEALKGIKALGYRSAREALAEKFHMSEELLAALNPKAKFDKTGERIAVANLSAEQRKAVVSRIDVDKKAQTVKVYAKSGELLGFYPATVGSDEKPTPSGTLKVVAIKPRPTYRYNPDYKFKGVKTDQPFTVAAGPNNPVGSVWIELSEKGYGIHGTPEPSKISKSESNGCVRLTNWDAMRIAELLKKGVVVNFTDGDVPISQAKG